MEGGFLVRRAAEGTVDFGGSREFKGEDRGDIRPSVGLKTRRVNRLLRRRSPFSFGELRRNEDIASNFQSGKSAMSAERVHDPSFPSRSLRDKRNSNPCRASGLGPVNTDQERKPRESELRGEVNSCAVKSGLRESNTELPFSGGSRPTQFLCLEAGECVATCLKFHECAVDVTQERRCKNAESLNCDVDETQERLLKNAESLNCDVEVTQERLLKNAENLNCDVDVTQERRCKSVQSLNCCNSVLETSYKQSCGDVSSELDVKKVTALHKGTEMHNLNSKYTNTPNISSRGNQQSPNPDLSSRRNATQPNTRVNLLSFRYNFLGYIFLFLSYCGPSLGFCPSGCLCDNVQLAVQCLSGRMDVVPILLNPGTIHLDLSHNRIKTILPGFAFYHELKVLNVSFNEIVALGESNFVSQVALKVLVIKNNKISKLDDRAFVGLSSLEQLDASNNYIEYIHSNTFITLRNLNKVDLSGNRIRTLSSDVFRNLTNLTTLDLCKNLLTEIPSNLFDPLVNLKELYLCSNEIAVLRDASFVTLRRLSFLSLQSNKIELISQDAFSGLESLAELSLYGNLLTSIPTLQMRLIMSLEDLDLSLNLISYIPASSFSSLASLKKLSVSQCSTLSRIDLKAFDTLSSLTALELSFSPLLQDFQIEALRPLSQLRRLILRGNGIKTLSKDLLDIGHLQYVDLRDNEFNCACALKWLKDARRNESLDVEIEDVICAAPDAVSGKSISALTEYDFRCYGHLITIAISAAVTLTVLLLLVIAFAIYYKNCRKMKTLVHDNWPDKIVTTWRDTDYQKQVEDDEYTFHSLRGVHHIPVTVI